MLSSYCCCNSSHEPDVLYSSPRSLQDSPYHFFFYFTTLSSGNRAFRYLPKMRFSLLSIAMAALGSFTTAAAAAPLDVRGVAVPAEGEWLEASVAQQRREALLESGLESRGLEGVSRSPSAVWENTHTHTHTHYRTRVLSIRERFVVI